MKKTHLFADAAAATAAENPWLAPSAHGGEAAPANGTEAPAPADAANPWQAFDIPGESQPAADAAEAGDAWLEMDGAATGAGDWLGGPASDAAATQPDAGFHLAQLWDGSLPVQDWINDALAWFVLHFRPFFQMLRVPIDSALTSVESALQVLPLPVMMVIVGLVAWQLAGRAIAVLAVVFMFIIGMMGVWQEAMVTLALVLTSLVFCVLIGLPLGIGLAASDRAERISRPVLDAMQTTPAFVYLVPVVMLFGIGNVPGVIVTIIFALPPLVRLTTLGIRQVRSDLIEASHAYGASPWQVLLKVQLPLAMPSIMAGINQSLMLALSMVVIASMIAVGGLGQMVLRGIGRLDMGLATVGGLGIVLLAIALDRITQAVGQHSRGKRHWYEGGPVGLFWRMFARRRPAPAATHAAEGR